MSCTIKKCKSRMGCEETRAQNISFHRFPGNETMQARWIAALPVGFKIKKHHRLCSRHFTPDCFTSEGRFRRLIETAVPTLNLRLISDATESSSARTTPISSEPTLESESPEIKDEMPDHYYMTYEIHGHDYIKSEYPPYEDNETPSDILDHKLIEKFKPIENNNSADNSKHKKHSASSNLKHIDHNNGAKLRKRISELEKRVAKLEKVAKKRYLKINCLTQLSRRLRIKNTYLYDALTDLLPQGYR